MMTCPGPACNIMAMPRKPLPPDSRSVWSLGPKDIENRPKHLMLIARILTLWPYVDLQLGIILGLLLGTDPESTVAIFSLVRQFRTQRDMILAAAESRKLSPEDFETLEATLIEVGAASKERDALAHGQWGLTPKLPDAVLWVETKHAASWTMEMLVRESAGRKRTGTEHAQLAEKMFIYDLKDLRAVYEQVDDVWRIAFEVSVYIRWKLNPHLQPGIIAMEAERRLKNLPRLQAAITRLRQEKQMAVARAAATR